MSIISRQFESLLFFRGMADNIFKDLSEEQLLKVPEGLNNNILWNVGHILFYEAVFLYGQAGQSLPVPEHYGDLFKGGASPSDWDETPDVGEIVERYKTQASQSIKDYEDGKFENYQPMKINEHFTLNTLEEGMSFHLFHEGVHVGRIGTLKSLV